MAHTVCFPINLVFNHFSLSLYSLLYDSVAFRCNMCLVVKMYVRMYIDNENYGWRRRRMRRKLMAKLSQWHYSLNSLLPIFFSLWLIIILAPMLVKLLLQSLCKIINWYTHDRLVISFFLPFYLYLVICMSFFLFFLLPCLLAACYWQVWRRTKKDPSQSTFRYVH